MEINTLNALLATIADLRKVVRLAVSVQEREIATMQYWDYVYRAAKVIIRANTCGKITKKEAVKIVLEKTKA